MLLHCTFAWHHFVEHTTANLSKLRPNLPCLPHPSLGCHPQRVKIRTLPRLVAAFALAASLTCIAQDNGYWRAASTTANSITGDIEIKPSQISINFLGFPMVQARTLTPAEVSAAFDADINAGATGVLYHLTIPASQRFLHKNTLCGTDQVQWMATYVSGRNLQIAFFSNLDAPVFTFDALSKSTDLCGTFTYAR